MPDNSHKDGFWVSRNFVNAIFIAAALLLWYSSYQAQPEVAAEGKSAMRLFSEILKDIGVVIFSLALVDMIWDRFGGDPVRVQITKLAETTTGALEIVQQAHAAGLAQVIPRIGNVSDDELVKWIATSQLQIDMCAYTLYYFFEREKLARALHERVRAGVPVRILIGDPSNANLFSNVQPQTRRAMEGQMRFVAESISKWTSKPAVPASQAVARKLSAGSLNLSVLRFDDRMIVLHYLWTCFTSETPSILVQGQDKPLFQIYAGEFDHLFGTGTQI